MVSDKTWQDRAKRLLKAELKRTDVSYRGLAERLNQLGLNESEANIANKISRGGFSAAFFFQCMAAIGCTVVNVPADWISGSQN